MPQVVRATGEQRRLLLRRQANDTGSTPDPPDRRRRDTPITEARHLAQRIGEDRNDFGTEFGPINVEIHAVAVAVELGDAGMALDLAETIDLTPMSDERKARFLIDVARAQIMRRQIGEALRSLEQAEKLTPEQTRALNSAREVAYDLVQLAGSRPGPELKSLAERFGILP